MVMSWCARENGAKIVNQGHMHYPKRGIDPQYVTHHYITPEQAKELYGQLPKSKRKESLLRALLATAEG